MVLRVVWAGPTVGAIHWFESLLLGLVWSMGDDMVRQ